MVMLFIALLLVAMKSTAMSTSFVNFEKKTRNLCVRNITQSADGLMWLTAEDGLYSFDGYHLVRHSFLENSKEHRDVVQALTKDAKENNGVGNHNNYSDFVKKPTCTMQFANHTWVGTARSLQLMTNGKVEKEWPMPVVKCLSNTANEVLVGTDNGLFVIDLQTMEVSQHVLHDTSKANSLAGDAVWCMFKDRKGNLWLGTNGGVSVLPSTLALRTYPLANVTGETRGCQIHVAFSDSKNRLWLGGTNGLILIENLDMPNQTCRWYIMGSNQYPLPHNRVRTICETSQQHTITIGGDGGLLKYDEATQQFIGQRIAADNNWIYNISQLPEHKLLISTFNASYVVDEDDFSKTYPNAGNKHDNSLRSSDILKQYGLEEEYLTAFDDKTNNRIIFGGTDEFTILDKSILTNQQRAPLIITDIKVNGQCFISHDDTFQSNEFTLDKDTRMLEIYFTDFDYNGSMPTSYQYSIDDGRTWITCHDGTLLLTNLSPGSYNVTLKSADDISTLTIKLHIQSPWYATWWAYTLYLIIFIVWIAGGWLLVRQRRRIIREHHEREELLKSAHEKEQRLISENEHLANQLHVQLLQSHMEENREQLSDDERLLLKVTTIIEDNMSRELDVARLSELTGIHQKQLYRKIKDMTGMTTVAYIRDLRLKKAATLLAKGGFSVAEVMYRVGFSNPSYFTRCFQEVYGMSPSEYIKQNANT